jgi:hypothetical protein
MVLGHTLHRGEELKELATVFAFAPQYGSRTTSSFTYAPGQRREYGRQVTCIAYMQFP